MGFVGENGAGKSTTIGCILNTLFRDKGEIRVLGKEMRDQDTNLRQRIGVVYDGDNFPGYYTAEQVGEVMSGIYRKWEDEYFDKYLDRFGLDKKQEDQDLFPGNDYELPLGPLWLTNRSC